MCVCVRVRVYILFLCLCSGNHGLLLWSEGVNAWPIAHHDPVPAVRAAETGPGPGEL